MQEALKNFRQPVYVRTKRSEATYRATQRYVVNNLARLTEAYRAVENDEQTLRLIRDDMIKVLEDITVTVSRKELVLIMFNKD